MNRFGAQVVRVSTKDESMIVHAFRKGICPGHFSESLIRSRPTTFAEIRRRAVAHIAAEGEVNEKRTSVVPSGAEALATQADDQAHEMPIHGEIHTIADRFSSGGCTSSQRKRYARSVMSVEEQAADDLLDVDLTFTRADLRDDVPHDNDPVVISVVIAGRKMHRVLVDQGSSTDVMFWSTFNKLQLSLDLLRPYTGCLYGFAGDQVEVRGYLELRTTFTDGSTSRTENTKYLVVNGHSAYNILLGRSALNRLRGVSSTHHMKMKLPDLSGKMIVIKSDQQEAKRCYESSLKMQRGVFMVLERPPLEKEDRTGVALLAKEMGARSLLTKSDSLLVTGQVTGEYQAKDPQMAT